MDVTAALRAVGIDEGDTVMVHSSYLALVLNLAREERPTPAQVVQDLIEAVGPAGTVVFPTFNFAFCSSGWWDEAETPSRMGILTEIARTRPDARRVIHPFYSCAAIGALAPWFGALRPTTAYGADSVFAALHEREAKILILGLDYQTSMTFFHYIEDCARADYRFHKDFPGQIRLRNGAIEAGNWSMFVRKIEDGVITCVNPMGSLLEAEGIVRLGSLGGGVIRAMRARAVFDCCLKYRSAWRGLLWRHGTREEAEQA